MRMHPWEFRRYTPREFQQRVQGWQQAEREQWRRTAALACWVLSPYTEQGKTLTPDELLGWRK